MYSSSFVMTDTMNGGNPQMNRDRVSFPSSAMDFLVSSAEDENNDTLYCEDDENDNGEKASKSRERNREHAKRTRLRKKAMLEGMKGKLMDLQRESTKLQQAFEERRTANILIAFSKPTMDDGTEENSNVLEMTKDMYAENVELSSYKGNIIEQLRTKVRTEAAQKNQHATMLRQSMKSNGVTFLESRLRRDSIGSDTALKEFNESTLSLSSATTTTGWSHVLLMTNCRSPCHVFLLLTLYLLRDSFCFLDSAVVDMDSDNDDVDLESYQPLPKSIVNWKSGTVINEDGQERRLADEEVEQFRSVLNLFYIVLPHFTIYR